MHLIFVKRKHGKNKPPKVEHVSYANSLTEVTRIVIEGLNPNNVAWVYIDVVEVTDEQGVIVSRCYPDGSVAVL